jgi:hypothetical protein
MAGLRELVQAEIARRTEANESFNPFSFTVNDAPGALTDVAAAVRAIEAQTAAGNNAERVTIASGIRADVEKALAAAHPRRFARPGVAIIRRVIIKPGLGDIPHAPWRSRVGDDTIPAEVMRPGRFIDDGEPLLGFPETVPDAIEHGAERISKLRDHPPARTDQPLGERQMTDEEADAIRTHYATCSVVELFPNDEPEPGPSEPGPCVPFGAQWIGDEQPLEYVAHAFEVLFAKEPAIVTRLLAALGTCDTAMLCKLFGGSAAPATMHAKAAGEPVEKPAPVQWGMTEREMMEAAPEPIWNERGERLNRSPSVFPRQNPYAGGSWRSR